MHRTVARKTLVLGVQHYARRDLEAVRDAGQRLQIRVLGLASIADDVSPELALATIESVEVLGALRASSRVKPPVVGGRELPEVRVRTPGAAVDLPAGLTAFP